MRQQKLNLYKGTRGGRRPGCGRKRIHSKGVAHRSREAVSGRTPLHISFRFRSTVRNKQNLRLLKRAILNARRMGLKIVHSSLQSNHVHFIIEAADNEILTRGMRSLTVTFAKGLKKGRVQVERYHLHVLKSLAEAKNAVMYVLFNKQKHERGTYSTIDEYSSVLMLKNALQLIKEFAKSGKMTLEIHGGRDFDLDPPRSFLLSRALRPASP